MSIEWLVLVSVKYKYSDYISFAHSSPRIIKPTSTPQRRTHYFGYWCHTYRGAPPAPPEFTWGFDVQRQVVPWPLCGMWCWELDAYGGLRGSCLQVLYHSKGLHTVITPPPSFLRCLFNYWLKKGGEVDTMYRFIKTSFSWNICLFCILWLLCLSMTWCCGKEMQVCVCEIALV